MRYNLLGRTGLRVSELCLGTMTFGGSEGIWKAIGGLDPKTAADMVARALDVGVNFFDTADGYGGGDAELFLGKALGARRNDVIVATKAGFPTGPGQNDRGLSRVHLFAAAEASLRRLGTDYIDLYFAHKRDPLTPVDETMRALEDLVRAGKVRHLGVSNWPAWQMMQANAEARLRGWSRFECAQMYYNLAARELERESVPCCEDQHVSVMVWSPLAGGVLTGKYGRQGQPPAQARRASFELGPMDYAAVNRIVDVAREIAQARGVTVAQVALAWLLAQKTVTSVIVGAKRMTQLEDNLGAAALILSDVERARLTAVSEPSSEYPGWYLKQFDDF